MTVRRRARAALLALALALAAAAVAGCSADEPVDDPQRAGASSGDQSTSPSPSGSVSDPGSPASTPSGPDAGTTAVPVYFVGETPMGARLYREFHQVEGDAASEALTLAAAGSADDPDYRTLLPGGEFSGVTWDEAIRVPLPDDSWTRRPAGMTESEALLAVQQLVYTVQGVVQRRSPVVFVDSSGAGTQILGIASEDGFAAADPLRTLALVNVTSPEEGRAVSGSFTASGVASSFEATVPWQVRRGDEVVLEGFATAEGWIDRLYPWEAEVDVSGLSPGDYTFVAMTDDPSGGEGPGPFVDSKTIRVD